MADSEEQSIEELSSDVQSSGEPQRSTEASVTCSTEQKGEESSQNTEPKTSKASETEPDLVVEESSLVDTTPEDVSSSDASSVEEKRPGPIDVIAERVRQTLMWIKDDIDTEQSPSIQPSSCDTSVAGTFRRYLLNRFRAPEECEEEHHQRSRRRIYEDIPDPEGIFERNVISDPSAGIFERNVTSDPSAGIFERDVTSDPSAGIFERDVTSDPSAAVFERDVASGSSEGEFERDFASSSTSSVSRPPSNVIIVQAEVHREETSEDRIVEPSVADERNDEKSQSPRDSDDEPEFESFQF